MNVLPERRKVFLEIDYILACTDVQSVEEVAFFKKQGTIITAVKTHYVFPGVIEFIRALYNRYDVEVGFYCLDENRRNIPFVQKLLKLALGKERYKAIKTHLIVISAIDSASGRAGIKDLSRFGKDILIVDFTFSNLYPEQLEKLLWIPPTNANCFNNKNPLPIDVVYIETGSLTDVQCSEVERAKCIIVQRYEGKITLHYLDKYERRTADVLDSLPQDVVGHVTSRGGVVTCTKLSQNRIFLLTALLMQVLDDASVTKQPLALALKRVQYDKEGTVKWSDTCLYKMGLNKLREINPRLDFTTPEKVAQVYQEILSDNLRVECSNLLICRWAKKRVFFDIDEVLSCHDVNKIELVAFFAMFGMIIHVVRSQYVFPGVKEFMQAAFDWGLEVGFYSSASQERNLKYVKDLLEASLKHPPEKVPVLNKLVNFPAEVKKQEFVKYGKHTIDKHKDLGEALQPGEEIENILIADDVIECAAPGQIKNMLEVPWTDASNFEKWDYSQNIPFRICYGLGENDREVLISGTAIIIDLTENKEEVLFLDKDTGEFKCAAIKNVEWLTEVKNHKYYVHGELQGKLRAWVEGLNGKTTQICRHLNYVYYLAGLLFTVVREAEESGQSLAKTLFKRQFRKIKTGKYEKRSSLKDDAAYYHYGLKILRKYNANLDFMTPERIQNLYQIPISPEMREKYESHLNYGKSK